MQQQQQSLFNDFLNISEPLKMSTCGFLQRTIQMSQIPHLCLLSSYQTSLQLWSLPLFHILTTEILRVYLRNYKFRDKWLSVT